MFFFRKLKTFRLTIARCSNWIVLTQHKLGFQKGPLVLKFRDGMNLKAMPPLTQTWGEIFEPAIADIYGIRGCAPDIIIDVGANIGAVSCTAAYAHPKAVVHSFEPSTVHADLLAENAGLNSLSNITLHRKAVTKNGRTVTFTQLGAGGASGIILHEGGISITIDSVSLANIDLSDFRFLFLKLDCEGAEGEIIEGLCENTAHLPDKVTIGCEYHHWCPEPLDALEERLRQAGFLVEKKTLFGEAYVFAFRNLAEDSSH